MQIIERLSIIGSCQGLVLTVLAMAPLILAIPHSASAAPAFELPGTETFPMDSELQLLFTIATPVTGLFTGTVDMTHDAAINDLGGPLAPPGPDEVPLTINSLTQSFTAPAGVFTITEDPNGSAGGTATSDNFDSDFPATSVLTVDYIMTTPFAPPNDVLHGTHTLEATLEAFPPTDIYAGTTPTTIFNSLNVDVGTLQVPAHSRCLSGGPGCPGGSAFGPIGLGMILSIIGLAVYVTRRRLGQTGGIAAA